MKLEQKNVERELKNEEIKEKAVLRRVEIDKNKSLMDLRTKELGGIKHFSTPRV